MAFLYKTKLLLFYSSKSKVPVWPFLSLSFFGGIYALLPYFVLWKPPPPPVEEAQLKTWPLNFLESKVTASVSSHLNLKGQSCCTQIIIYYLNCETDTACFGDRPHNLRRFSRGRCMERILPVLQRKQICKFRLNSTYSWPDSCPCIRYYELYQCHIILYYVDFQAKVYWSTRT